MLTIRAAEDEDAPALAAIYAPAVIDSPISFELEPPGADEMRRRLRGLRAFAPYLVAVADGQVRGFAYASPHHERAAYRWAVNTTVYVDPARHRAGVGSALYRALLPRLRAQGFLAAHAGITLPNPGSIGLHERFGFARVASYPKVGWKCGAWHDVGWWQLELGPRDAEPAELKPVA